MQDNYNILIDRLDAFIKKYYTNLLIKGVIYSIALLGTFLIIITLFESILWFSTTIRTILFYSYVTISTIIIALFIIDPVLKLSKIGRRLSHDMAAQVIGRHFSDVKDTLLNTLQLKRLADTTPDNYELILAGINKKSQKLMNVPFKTAIDYSANKKYLFLALPPLVIITTLLMTSPRLLTEPGTRIIKHSIAFEKPLPFRISINNEKLEAVQQEDFILDVSLSGEELPNEIYLVIDGKEFKMNQKNRLNFNYNFKKIQKDQEFKLFASGYYSNEYKITVLPKPIILNYDIELRFPQYIGKESKIISNVGDINVPQGTELIWKFYTRDAERISFRLGEEIRDLTSERSNTFTTSHKLMQATGIVISSQNKFITTTDSLMFYANAIPDLHPTIGVDQYSDSVYDNRLYFRGLVRDDYGFRDLKFKLYKVNHGEKGAEMSINIPIQKNVAEQDFYFFYDLMSLGLNPGENILYYFEIWDNDGVNGSKSARSEEMTFKIPTLDEINKMVDDHQTELKDDFSNTIKEAKAIQKEIDKLNKSLIDKKDLNFQDKKQIENILQRHTELQNKIEKMKLENKQINTKESQIKKVDETILQKQQQLEKLFHEIMTPEMKKMFEELQKMMDEMNKDKVKDMLDKLKLQSQDIEKDLDRNLELFKQLEFDKKLTEAIEDLKKLADEEKKLAEETSKSNKGDSDNLSKKQDEINKKFDEITKDLEELKKLNSELENPNNFDIPQDQKKETEQELNESTKSLKESQMKKASDHQQKASEKMQKISQTLFEMQQEMENEQLGEDVDALRAILENLVRVSFDQEDLMGRVKVVNRSDPKYPSMVEEQKKLRDNISMIQDSILALSKRQPMIEGFVNKEIRDINANSEQAMEALQNRATAMAGSKQQYVMTSVNNLALLLSEALKNMEQNLSMQTSGKSGKSKPKPGKGQSMKSMRQMQEKLNQQLEEMQKGMQPKQGEKGEQGKQTSSQMSEQLARMAAQQEALRKMLQQYSDELKKDGDVNQQGLQKMIQEMEKTETELVNKVLNKQTMERQQEILTRLLESEKAELKREQEEKRESNEGKDLPKPDPAKYFDKLGLPSKETELINTIPPSFRNYYRNKVNSYFIQIPGNK